MILGFEEIWTSATINGIPCETLGDWLPPPSLSHLSSCEVPINRYVNRLIETTDKVVNEMMSLLSAKKFKI